VACNPEDRYSAQWAERHRQDLIKRTGVDPQTGLKVKKKTAKAERMKSVRCTYCGKNGHTRRICKPLKEDYAVFVEGCKIIRSATLTRMNKEGWSIGALIIRNAWINEAHAKRPFLLTRLNWAGVTAFVGIDITGTFRLTGAISGRGYHTQSHEMARVTSRADRYNYSGTSVGSTPPDGWLDGEDIIEEGLKPYFPVGEHRRWCFRPTAMAECPELWIVQARKNLAITS